MSEHERAFRFEYRRIASLPRLAWCARVSLGGSSVIVVHGPWVDTNPEFFCEGAWSGDFTAGAFAEATAFFGSGGCIRNDRVCFAAATHTYERLHSIRLTDTVLVSNSLAFLLSQADDELDPAYPFYDVDLMSFKLGLDSARRSVPTLEGRTVRLHYCCNVLIDSQLRVREQPKRQCDPFRGYRDYIDYVGQEVGALCANAADPGRRRSFAPLTSVSAGYDSPAASLFARRMACEEAFTFTEARPGYAATDDSGRKIGELLGLSVREYSRTDYLGRTGFPEAEFLATGTGGEEVVFAAVEALLPGRILFTGYFGDAAWSRRYPVVGTRFRIRNPASASFTEFRLRLGYINFALPALGFVHQPALQAISNSEEMRPWRTGNDYDRPIPRRLLEEAGIPGHLFGQHKMAVSQPFYSTKGELASLMNAESYEDFQRFTGRLRLFPSAAFALRFRAGRAFFDLNQRVNWKLEAVADKRGRQLRLDTLISERYARPLRWNAYTVHWGVSKVLPRYAISRTGDELHSPSPSAGSDGQAPRFREARAG